MKAVEDILATCKKVQILNFTTYFNSFFKGVVKYVPEWLLLTQIQPIWMMIQIIRQCPYSKETSLWGSDVLVYCNTPKGRKVLFKHTSTREVGFIRISVFPACMI